MAWLFLTCAVVGGTVIVCQFALTLIGFGGMELDTDVPDDFPSDMAHDVGDGLHGHDSSWLFSVISLRTMTAAIAFFGLGGYAMHANGSAIAAQLGVGIFCGVCALFTVHWLFKQLNRLSEDGTERIGNAIGEVGQVYLTIPARGGGPGKVQFELQGRMVEYPAVTSSLEPLPTGSKIRIVAMSGNVLEVETASRPSKVEVG